MFLYLKFGISAGFHQGISHQCLPISSQCMDSDALMIRTRGPTKVDWKVGVEGFTALSYIGTARLSTFVDLTCGRDALEIALNASRGSS